MEKDDKEDKLKTLIAAGPDPTRGLQNLVLSRFVDISRARADLREWPEIAAALDMPGRSKALAAAFSRVRRRVENKELEPPKSSPTSTARQTQARTEQQASAISATTANSEPGQKPARPGWTNIPLDK